MNVVTEVKETMQRICVLVLCGKGFITAICQPMATQTLKEGFEKAVS